MPNILIVGFEPTEALKLRDRIDAIMIAIETDKGQTAVTTILDVPTKSCASPNPSPYLVVRTSNLEHARHVAHALYTELNVDIELEKIDGFSVKRSFSEAGRASS